MLSVHIHKKSLQKLNVLSEERQTIGKRKAYRNLLSVVDWDELFRNDDIDITTIAITNTILDAANKTIPNRYITVKKDYPPWITTKIKSTYAVKIEFTKKQRNLILSHNGKHF